jgi:hypothetical protein
VARPKTLCPADFAVMTTAVLLMSDTTSLRPMQAKGPAARIAQDQIHL